jgi:hypothetical protein
VVKKSLLDGNNKYRQFFNIEIIENPFVCYDDFLKSLNFFKGIKGLYYYEIHNQVSSEEKKKLEQINKLASDISNINNEVINHVKGEMLFDEVNSLMKFLQYYRGLGEKYVCMSQNYVAYSSISESEKYAEQNCRGSFSLISPLPDFKEREEALDFFISDLKEKYDKADSYRERIKTKLIVK